MELRNKIEPFPSKRNVFPYLTKESQRVPPRPGRRFPQERLLPAGVPEAAPPSTRGSPDRLPGQTPPPPARLPAAPRPDRPDVPPASSAASPASPSLPPGNFPETSRHPSPFLRLPTPPRRPRNSRHAHHSFPRTPARQLPGVPRTLPHAPPAPGPPFSGAIRPCSAPVPPHFPAPALPPARRSPRRILPPGPTFHLTSGREQRTQ